VLEPWQAWVGVLMPLCVGGPCSVLAHYTSLWELRLPASVAVQPAPSLALIPPDAVATWVRLLYHGRLQYVCARPHRIVAEERERERERNVRAAASDRMAAHWHTCTHEPAYDERQSVRERG
jgi:hypothetical protein